MSKLSQWELKGVPMKYPIAFIILLLPILFWNFNNIHYFDEFEIAPDSATYLLSALVQSLAAIIAIVVTLTLVAVQLAASAYSPRVIDIFKKDWVMWFLLVWYGLSIFFGLFVLEVIGGKYQNLSHWGVSLESCVFIVYLMGVAAFVGVFFHIGNVIDLLKPENIIKKLSNKITSENVLEFIISEEKQNNDRTEPAKDDPVQPIVDIIHGSVMKYDIATTGYGLKAITEKAIEVVCSDYEKADGGRKISEYFCVHLIRIGKLTVSIGDSESVTEVLKSLEFFGKSTAEKGLEVATSRAAWSLGDVGKAAAEKGLEDAARQAAWSLEDVGKIAAEKGFKGATAKAAYSLIAVGTTATENRLEDVARKAAKALAVLTISSEEIVKVEIQNYELQLQHDCDSFRRFMQVYEEKLGELRAKKNLNKHNKTHGKTTEPETEYI